jgi:hypothetical protein
MNITDMYNLEKKKIETVFEGGIDSNKTYTFYGICGNQFKLNDTIFEAIEDPNDGYRSCLETIKVANSDGIFSRNALAIVKIEEVEDGGEDSSFSGYILVDIDTEHRWLFVGTDSSDSYYPYFVFQYDIPQLGSERN